MKYAHKLRIANFIKNAEQSEERDALMKIMNHELQFADLPNMTLCTDDEGCENFTMDELEGIAEKVENVLMEDFNPTLREVLEEL